MSNKDFVMIVELKKRLQLNNIVLGKTTVSIVNSNILGIITAKERRYCTGNIMYKVNIDSSKYIWLEENQFNIIEQGNSSH